MKIEICEQLICSWLKHCKGCQIVQVNWTPSPYFNINDGDFAIFSMFIQEIKDIVGEIDIFKKSSVDQFIKQAEVDILGIRLEDGLVAEFYMIDSAFHSAGLGYSDNAARIPKKLIRTIGTAELYFKNIPTNIIFASPFARDSVETDIQAELNKIADKVTEYYPDMRLSLIFNEEFTNEIYNQVNECSDKISDTNELFIRSIKLAKVCDSFQALQKPTKSDFIPKSLLDTKTKRGGNEQTIFAVLEELKQRGLLKTNLLDKLQSNTYTKKNFKISSFPFLLKKNEFPNTDFERCRFYKNLFVFDGVEYMVCSQWIPERIRLLSQWLEKIRGMYD